MSFLLKNVPYKAVWSERGAEYSCFKTGNRQHAGGIKPELILRPTTSVFCLLHHYLAHYVG